MNQVAVFETKRIEGSRPPWNPDREDREQLVWWFSILFYDDLNRTWANTFYRGYRVWQPATDLWIYQELIYERRPDLIIETGTGYGGCALYFADMLDKIGTGKVITIDDRSFQIDDGSTLPKHKRIEYWEGKQSIHPEVLMKLEKRVAGAKEVMVFLDSSHDKDYVFSEINFYSKFVPVGGYMIVEDTNMGQIEESCKKFLKQNKDFEPDVSREKFYLTFNPGGYLKRMR